MADQQHGLHDSISGPRVTDKDMLAKLCAEVAIADAVYEKNAAAMCRSCVLKPSEVLAATAAAPMLPAGAK